MKHSMIIGLLCGAVCGPSPSFAAVKDFKVTTDRTIDSTSLETIVRDVVAHSGAKSNDEKAIAIYEYLHNTIFHWAYPTEAAPQSVGPLKMINVYGDPTKEGPYIFRMRLATGYKFSPHTSPDQQFVTLLKGILWYADGERYDPIRMKEYEAGAAFLIPAGQPSFLWARTEVVLQVLGTGPLDNAVQYINPDDVPRN